MGKWRLTQRYTSAVQNGANMPSGVLKFYKLGIATYRQINLSIRRKRRLVEKLTIKTMMVIHTEVPCCFGLTQIAREALAHSSVKMSFEDVTVSLQGNVSKTETIET